MSAQARELKDMVGTLIGIVGGSAASKSAHPEAVIPLDDDLKEF